MLRALVAVLLGVLLAWSGPAAAAGSKARAVARLVDRSGKPAGTATFIATSHGVLIVFDLKGLTPGPHAIHVHTAGNCDPKVAFTSAGPHFSSEPSRMHGYLSAHGPHAGDLPNEFAASDGTLKATVITNAFTIGNGKKSIFDRDGAAVIVHGGADDYMSQPAGNAGDRVACGVIMRTAGPGVRKGGTHRAHK